MSENLPAPGNAQKAPAWFKAMYALASASVYALKLIGRHILLLALLSSFTTFGVFLGIHMAAQQSLGCVTHLADGTILHYPAKGGVVRTHEDSITLGEAAALVFVPLCMDTPHP